MNDNILKDLVLSTLSEIEEEESLENSIPQKEEKREKREFPQDDTFYNETQNEHLKSKKSETYRNSEPQKTYENHEPQKPKEEKKQNTKITLEELSFDGDVDSEFDIDKPQTSFYTGSSDEVEFLENILKKSTTLIEGLKSPELKSREAKCDITLKYLQFLNVEILNRLEKIN
jgi:hypothetical protein